MPTHLTDDRFHQHREHEHRPDHVDLDDHLDRLDHLDVDLDGCESRDLGVNGDAHTIDAGGPLVLAPGALMVLAKTAVEADNGGIADVAYAFGDAFSLTNEGDAFVLRCGAVDVDIVPCP